MLRYVNLNKQNQQGFSLFVVLIMMLVIALLVIAGMQSSNTEMRISSNDADRKFAFSRAEEMLQAGERQIVATKHIGFTGGNSCSNGICKQANRATASPLTNEQLNTILENNQQSSCVVKDDVRSCFIIEPVGEPEMHAGSGAIQGFYRVTARSRGQNEQTVVTLQSFVEYIEQNGGSEAIFGG